MSDSSLALLRSARWPRSSRLIPALNRHLALAVAVVTLVGASSVLLLTHKSTPVAVPKAKAVRYALSDPAAAPTLRSVHWNRVDVAPQDRLYEIVGFYRGARMVASLTMGFRHRIVILDVENLTRRKYAYGSNIANDLRVLALLSVLFVLSTAVWPLWRLRNLDVLVAASTALSVVLFNRWLLSWMVAVSYPALIYLAIRCLLHGAGGRRSPAASVPLYDHLSRNWTAEARLRVLRLILLALVLIVIMVGFTSLHVLDVGYAVMEGATLITHGLLPYGHIPDVLHGDTYPIASYLLYVPLAWLTPVHNAWDDADATLVIAIAAALLVAGGLWWVRRPHGAASYSEHSAGLRVAIAALAFPPLLVTVSTGTTDVVLGALLVISLLLWRRPGAAATSLSAAAWFKLAPAAVLPLWLARLRGKELARAAVMIILFSLALCGLLVGLGGGGAPMQMLRAMSFQFTRSSPHTLWALVGSVPFQQLAQGATLALIAGACVMIRRDPLLAGDQGRIAAVAAAVLLGLQVTANYWNWMYLVWIIPFLLVSILDDTASTALRVQPEIDLSTHRAHPPIPA